jgi:hypothetical protein
MDEIDTSYYLCDLSMWLIVEINHALFGALELLSSLVSFSYHSLFGALEPLSSLVSSS